MKILFDHQIFINQKYGGVSRYHIELFKHINNSVNKLEIKSRFSTNHYLSEINRKKEINYKNLTHQRIVKFVNRVLNCFDVLVGNYDIVHMTWHSTYLFKFAKRKIVITVHDMIHEIYNDQGKKTIDEKKSSIYGADAIIAISENTKKDILKIYPDVPESKIHVVYHGTNHLPTPVKPKEFNCYGNYFLFVGVRGKYKNADVLYRAFAKLPLKLRDDISLVFVGGGEFSESERQRFKELQIDKSVFQCTVSDNELAYLYTHAICFVYPSKYEGFGFPILEAFDNDCPVLCSNTSSLPEVGGEAVGYFNPENEDELVELLTKIVNDENFRDVLIEKGRKRVREFTWERTADATMEVYKSLHKS